MLFRSEIVELEDGELVTENEEEIEEIGQARRHPVPERLAGVLGEHGQDHQAGANSHNLGRGGVAHNHRRGHQSGLRLPKGDGGSRR